LQIISALSVLFIVVSILSFCLKTHPNMRVPSIENVTLPAGVHIHRRHLLFLLGVKQRSGVRPFVRLCLCRQSGT